MSSETATSGQGESDRLAELRANLSAVHQRIERACRLTGRDPMTITLVVVTKTHPVGDLALLAELGVRDVGESRDQEAAAKHAELAASPFGSALVWHFVGRLQSNKARHVASYADLVHSVDRLSVIEPLGRGATAAGRTVGCLIQVSLDGDPGRAGALAPDVPALAEAVASRPGLVLRGVMAVAPLDGDPAVAFAVLPGLRDLLLRIDPRAQIVSAGMSGDLEAAVGVGATHLRVGSAVLGARSPLG